MELISRRKFVACGAALMSTYASWGRSSGRVLPPSIPIGLQLYSVGADLQKDVQGTLQQVRAIGYERVETAGFAGLSAKQFHEQLQEARLACLSMHLPVGNQDLEPLFADAHTIGAHYVVSSALFPPHTNGDSLADYEAMAARLNQMGRQARDAGLQYAYHNHNFEFRKLQGDKIGYDVLLKRTDPELVDFELDCGWMVAAGYNPIDYFKRYPGRYRMLHIKDFLATSAPSTSLAQNKRPQGTELGHGHIDYKPILLAAQRAGIMDYYVEQEPPFLDMPALAAVKVDYQYLRAL